MQVVSFEENQVKTYLPMPTVDQLVQLFKDKGWEPTPVYGCYRSNVKDGCCCALPAIIALGDPGFIDAWINRTDDLDIYKRADELYGEGANHIYCGFDANGCHIGPWYQLGLELRNALGVTRKDHKRDYSIDI